MSHDHIGVTILLDSDSQPGNCGGPQITTIFIKQF